MTLTQRSKYGNRRTYVDGIAFDSAKEATRYKVLLILQGQGHIQHLILQPRFDLVVNEVKIATYTADFQYVEDGEFIVEDVKGVRTRDYQIKKKLLKALYGITVYET